MPPDLPITVTAALTAAIDASEQVRGSTSPNPPVGAAILDSAGQLAGVGATQPPGGPHAEVMALKVAGQRARGGTAVVTLEPCNHTGRTGPCSHALADAGVAQVYYVHTDPGAAAGGGAEYLRSRGVEVIQLDTEVAVLRYWLTAARSGRPHVTLKFAQTLDGFTAALDGTSQWITGSSAREHVHADRAKRDAIIIGTGTALADNPALTARYPDGTLYENQPAAVVIGSRQITPAQAPKLAARGFSQHAEIPAALAALTESGAQDVLVEGGASLAGGFLTAGLVDSIQAYIAPTLLGQGRSVLATAITETLSGAAHFELGQIIRLEQDVLLELTRKV